jgi:hypothetical protein
MTEGIVHLLEVVEVDQHRGAGAVLRAIGQERALKDMGHAPPIEQAGQRVVHGEPRVFLGDASIAGDVRAESVEALEGALSVELRLAGERPPVRGLAFARLQVKSFEAGTAREQQAQASR